MNKAELLKKLKDEGFLHVFEWRDKAGVDYRPHAHKGKVSFYITEGNVTIWFKDGTKRTFVKGDRYDMPVGLEHWAKVGANGCSWVVGEEIEGDA